MSAFQAPVEARHEAVAVPPPGSLPGPAAGGVSGHAANPFNDLAGPGLDLGLACAALEAAGDGMLLLQRLPGGLRVLHATARAAAQVGTTSAALQGRPATFLRVVGSGADLATALESGLFGADATIGLLVSSPDGPAGAPPQALLARARPMGDLGWALTLWREDQRDVFDHMARVLPAPMLVTDSEMVVTWVNDRGAELLGCAKEELVGHSWYELVPEAAARRDAHRRAAAGDPVSIPVAAITLPGQRTRWASLDIQPLAGADGRVERLLFLANDITERVNAERALRESEERFRAITDHSRDMLAVVSADGTILWRSRAVATIMGRDPEEAVGTSLMLNVHPDDVPMARQRFELAVRDPSSTETDPVALRVRHGDGRWRWVEVAAKNLLHHPAVRGVVISTRDITERRLATLQLAEASERLELAVSGARVAIWHLDLATDELTVSDEWHRVRGWDPAVARSRRLSAYDEMHPEDRHLLEEIDARCRDGRQGDDYWEVEFRTRTARGEWMWMLERGRVVERDDNGKALRIGGVELDIDARRRTESELLTARRIIEQSVQSAGVATWETDVTTGLNTWNDAFYHFYGVAPAEGRRDADYFETGVHPEDLPAMCLARDEHLAGRRPTFNAEYRLRLANGQWRWVEDLGRVTARDADGKPSHMSGVTLDIDARKRAELALARSEQRYRTLVAVHPGYLHETEVDADGRLQVTWASDGFRRLLGWTLAEAQAEGSWIGLCHPDELDAMRARSRRVLGGETINVDIRLRAKDGRYHWLNHTSCPLVDAATGQVRSVFGSATDITARKHVEDALRQSEARYRAIASSFNGYVFEFVFGPDGTPHMTWASEGFELLHGTSVGSVGKTTAQVLVHPADRGKNTANLARLSAGEAVSTEFRLLHADGTVRWVRTHSKPVFGADGRAVTGAVGIAEDITAQKHSVTQLQESELRYRAITEMTPGFAYEAVYYGDLPTFTWVSPGFSRVLSYTFEEFAARPIADFYHPDDLPAMRERAGAMLRGESVEGEARLIDRDGRLRWVRIRSRPFQDSAGMTRVIGVIEDVTRKREAEALQRVSEERFRLVVEAVSGMIYDADLVADTVIRSAAVQDLVGLAPDEIAPPVSAWRALIHPDDLPVFDASMRAEAGLAEAHYRVRHYGAGRWVEVWDRAIVLRDEAGRAVRRVGCVVDESVQRRTARLLEEAESVARVGSWELDIDRQEMRWSAETYRIHELDAASGPISLTQAVAYYAPGSLAVMQNIMERALRTGESWDVDLEIITARGRRVWVRTSGRAETVDGQPRRLFGAFQDIDRLKRGELELRQQRRWLRMALDAARLAAWRWLAETDEVIIEYRGANTPQLGGGVLSFRRLLGSAHAEDRPGLEAAVQETLSTGEPVNHEFRVAAGEDGVEHWLAMRATRYHDTTGQVVGLIGTTQIVTERKQAERHLRDSEERFRLALESAPNGIVLADLEMRPVSVNAQMERLTGHDAGTLLSMPLWELLPPPDQDAERRRLLAFAGGGSETLDDSCELLRADGRRRQVRMTRAIVRDGAGQPAFVLVQAEDVTEMREAEAARARSEATLRTVAEASPDLVCLVNPDLTIAFVNREVDGVPPEQLVGQSVLDHAPNDRDWTARTLRGTLEHARRTTFEAAVTRPDGTRRFLESRIGPVEAAGSAVGQVLMVTSDITERRERENVLRTQAQVLATMLEGVVVVDREGIVRITNPAFDRMFGHEPGALDGTALSALLAGGSLRPVAAGRQALAAPAEFLGRRGGETFVGAAVASALAIAGEPYDVYVVQDITERKELEREIIDISNREQQRIGSDLHDGLGQELTGVALMLRGLSSRMKRGTPAKVDEIEEIVGFVNQAIESARSLARGLAPVSLERGGLVYALRALATRAADQFGIDVRFRNRVRPALTLDGTGATHLYRIAQESITNAARHGRAGNVQIQLNVNQQRVVLVITDDGSGLPEGALGAPGMGLKIMQYRARMLGGDVRVERIPEGGTRVVCEVRQPLPEPADLQRELGGVRS